MARENCSMAGMRLHQHGKDVYHHVGVSAFAEYCVVNRGSLVKIDKELALRRSRIVRMRGADRCRRGIQYRAGIPGREGRGAGTGRRGT